MRSEQIGPRLISGSKPMPAAAPTPAREQEPIALADESGFSCCSIHASNGLKIRVLPNGCVYAIDRGDILINQILASPPGGGIQRIYLRIHRRDRIHFAEIVGPVAASQFASSSDRFVWSGSWQGLGYRCTCWLHPSGDGWFFHVEVENRTAESIRCDAVIVQDIGLATRGQVRNNELFTSQYLDHRAMRDPEAGYLLMSRQNLPQPGETHPWLLQGCFPSAKGFTTDGFDFFGVTCRGDAAPVAVSRAVIGDRVRQYESAVSAVQSSDVVLDSSGSHAWTFFANFVHDHPDPSSGADVDRLQLIRAMAKDMASALAVPGALVSTLLDRGVFQTCEPFCAEDFDEADLERHFPSARRHEEDVDGRLFSFFHGEDARHVVLKSKELSVARPHGHILRAGRGMLPDDGLMSCACYAAGVFASQLALGNTSLGKLLSAMRDPLNVVRSSGLRILVRPSASDPWQLLGVPSAFEMALDQCRWYYKCGQNFITVSCIASEADPALTFRVHVVGQPVQLLICGEIAAGPFEYENSPRLSVDARQNRITIRPDTESLLGKKEPGIIFHVVTDSAEAVEAIGGDELLMASGESRGYPYFAIQTRATSSFGFTFLGTVGDDSGTDALCEKYERGNAARWRPPDAASSFWGGVTSEVRLSAPDEKIAQVQDALAWFARDALVHLSAPRGLEQQNGGAWGVRDVCQGPVEFLLSYGHREIVADVIRLLFSQQYARRGDWPQWFMFPPFQEIQSPECNGDVMIWPLKSLCDYLEHTNDATILQERLPYTDDETFQRTARMESLLEHADRLLRKMRQSFLPGLALPRYGEGDWDDSLQPADSLPRERMASAWTAELMYQTLRRYGAALARFGETRRAATANELAAGIEADFQRHMIPDGVVAGFAIFGGEPARAVEYLLHPRDRRTGIHYRLIPMTRGILSGIFSAKQADQHVELLRAHLLYPDGARLMDRPAKYDGGRERTFRRSESAAFFGREIGLQYVHAHLRYAEAMALAGRADDLWRALLVVNPIAVTQLVTNARPRQRNCYFSSSDAAFDDRYEASRSYDRLRRGEVPTDGGWRIYSSGPGIYTNLVLRHLFGIRRYFDCMEFDPVLPRELDGTACALLQDGRRVRYQFSVSTDVCSPKRISVNGVPVSALTRVANPYRPGGVRVLTSEFNSLLAVAENVVEVEL